jgi:hypothetical protein
MAQLFRSKAVILMRSLAMSVCLPSGSEGLPEPGDPGDVDVFKVFSFHPPP